MGRTSRRKFLGMGIPVIMSVPRMRGSESNGVVEVGLTASQRWVEVGGHFAFLYAYNSKVPGPLIEAKPGDEVRITLRNELPEATNLHFHGLHIPSRGNADNVMLRVQPGEIQKYAFTIPQDHPSGTYWYHPHVHGSAAHQVSSGLVGSFIVRNEEDSAPEITRTPETLLVLQDFALDGGGQPVEPNTMARMLGREGSLVTASGETLAGLEVQTEGWVRLRVINASSSRFYRLRLQEHPFYLVATDGGYLPDIQLLDEVLLTPGERVEVMVRGDRPPGEYTLWRLPYSRGGMGMMSGNLASEALRIGRLRYRAPVDLTWEIPARLARVDRLPGPSVRRSFQLGQGMGVMGGGMNFTINGRTFNENRIDVHAALNNVEDWEFINPTSMDHPMHVHTNAFQVIDGDGRPVPAWKDTVLVKAGSRLTIRTAFRDFQGVSMYHCHILDHEDLGMMGALEISAPGA